MKKQWTPKFITALLSNIFLMGTVMVFSPLEVYLGSYYDFHFQFGVAWQVMVLGALAAILLLTAIEMLLPRKLALFLNALTVALGVCCYVQMMFLNGKMIVLNGAQMQTTRAERIANLGVWAGMFAAIGGVSLVMIKKKPDLLGMVLGYVSAMLTVMQTVALVVLALTTNMTGANEYVLTGEGRFEVAKENNTLVFVLDSAENTIFEEVLRDFPDTVEALSGFTYYPDALSMYSRTYPSLTYMVTGVECHYDKPSHEYVEEATQKGMLLRELAAAGVDGRIFTQDRDKFSKSAKDVIRNMFLTEFNSFDKVSVPELFKGMLNISLYKLAPYRLKYELEYDMDKINPRIIRQDQELYQYYDYEYYHDLRATGVTVNENYPGALRFYHLFGSHHGMYWNENMEKADVMDNAQPLRGSLRIIEEFVSQLDALGVLDQTTIIVTADHGRWGTTESTDIKVAMNNPPTPIMLVKYPDSDMTKPMTVSSAPVCHSDLIAAMAEGCGLDKAAYGRSIREIGEDEERTRHYYYTAYSKVDNGELVQKEYQIDGDARSFDNWQFTGNYWEVRYSPYAVSKSSYEKELEN